MGVGIFLSPILLFRPGSTSTFFFFPQQKNVSLVPGYGNEAEKKPVFRGEGGKVTDGT